MWKGVIDEVKTPLSLMIEDLDKSNSKTPYNRRTPDVGLEPTTDGLRVHRSTD